jgi:FKBP12-rapamycin complex-associated protein
MERETFPEKVPFRLTRMLVNAMEVSGIEGNFRNTCEVVMGVLRENRDSLMAIFEAFVSDPVITWRLEQPEEKKDGPRKDGSGSPEQDAADAEDEDNDSAGGDDDDDEEDDLDRPTVLARRRSLDVAQHRPESVVSVSGQAVISDEAKTVIDRVEQKLSGRDFNARKVLPVTDQVQRLIVQATAHENLCQGYLGWQPYW